MINNSDKTIPFNKPFIAGKELYYIAQSVIKNSHISGDGQFTLKCQKWLENRLSCRKALLTHSCTAALEMAAILLDIQPGDEVIMPSFTFVSTANAFVLRGAVPVFIDIHSDTLNLDERLIPAAITNKTRAIVPVHYAGVPCEMGKISDIAHQYNLLIVEDAAQALFSNFNDKYLGTIGDLGTLSFHETKNIICGEGGALLINNSDFIERAEIIREKGTNRSQFFRGKIDKYSWVDIGSSYLPSDIIAAFLYAQLEMTEKIVQKRCRLFNLYYEALKEYEQQGICRLPKMINNCESNGHIFYIITNSLEERTRMIDFLKERKIMAVFHYLPLHSSIAGRRFGRCKGDLAVVNDLSERLLRLPLYFEMSENDVFYVVDTIKKFYSQYIYNPKG